MSVGDFDRRPSFAQAKNQFYSSAYIEEKEVIIQTSTVIGEERINRVTLDKNLSWDYGRKSVKRKGNNPAKGMGFLEAYDSFDVSDSGFGRRS